MNVHSVKFIFTNEETRYKYKYSALQKKHLILFFQPLKNTAFLKNRKSKSRLDQMLCQFLFFHCGVKLAKLGQISCVIPYYIGKTLYIWASFSLVFLKIGTKWERL